ncbi:MAG: hypothetical protein RLZZ550_355 [Verrucomicrobiota bacterium]|jgi:hypothetical protein
MRLLLLPALALAGCAVPANDPSFRTEKSPAAAALAGEAPAPGSLEERIRAANETNDRRRREGDWRAAKPAVGPAP